MIELFESEQFYGSSAVSRSRSRICSLLGIGGGPIRSRFLICICLDMPKAAGTSLAVVIPAGLAALAGYLLKAGGYPLLV